MSVLSYIPTLYSPGAPTQGMLLLIIKYGSPTSINEVKTFWEANVNLYNPYRLPTGLSGSAELTGDTNHHSIANILYSPVVFVTLSQW